MSPPVLKPGPVTRVCHVCGRQYGLSSFDIHLKQCKKMFIAQVDTDPRTANWEELKPRGERRPVPKTPPGLDGSGANDMALNNGKPPSREEIEAMNKAAQETFNVHGMESCENCGRTFAEGRLAIHLRSCRPGNMAKRIEDGAVPRNKKEREVDYGRAQPNDRQGRPTSSTTSSVMKPSQDLSARPPSRDHHNDTPSRPSTSTVSPPASRPLSGSLASNRKKSPTTMENGDRAVQPPSSQIPASINIRDINARTLQTEINGNTSMLPLIQAKLDHWEATTLSTLEEIRALKTLFIQLQN